MIVNSGDILVGKVQIREMPRNRLLADMDDPIRDVSLRVPSGMFGMVTEVQIERRRGLAGNRDHVKRTRMIEDMIEDILSGLFLGDRLGANVVDDEAQKCLVPANKKITRTDIRRMVERRDSLSIEDTHVKARIETVFKEFRPYFDALSRDIASIRNVHVSLKRKEGQ